MRSVGSPARGRLVDVYSPQGRDLGLVTGVSADLIEPGAWRVSVQTRGGEQFEDLPLFQRLSGDQRVTVRGTHTVWAEWRLPSDQAES